MRSKIKRLLRPLYMALKSRALIYVNYYYDLRRFRSGAALFSDWNRDVLDARITMDYHRIEKGLALKQPKIGFGEDVVARLLHMVPGYEAKYGECLATRAARIALSEYIAMHRRHEKSFPEIDAFLATASGGFAEPCHAGTMNVSKQSIHTNSLIDFQRFANSRYSVRQFTGEVIVLGDIEKAVQAALKTPSVCNRQTARVHALFESGVKKRALSFQNGNRGFGDQAGAVLIVTSDLQGFTSISERNQGWIDGGLFSMSLVYALHAQGFGTCMLNWSADYKRDAAMREAMHIPENEAVIMMIAVGHLLNEFSVACSPRRSVSEVLRIKA